MARDDGVNELKIVLKVGGSVLEEPGMIERCVRATALLAKDGHQIALVHGGGKALSKTLERLGKETKFINGLRVTDAETRDIALMVLAGQVNKQLVASFARLGQPAVGMCGGDGLAFRARKKKDADLGYVGDICAVNPEWIFALWQHGAVPVISSIALGYDGEYYNVNADQTAAACAVACEANALIFLTDVPGVWNEDGALIRHLSAKQIANLIAASAIKGGMLPKLEACQKALSGGVSRVRILPATEVDALPDFYFTRVDAGTEVFA
jgi:acetylglutamate kinase